MGTQKKRLNETLLLSTQNINLDCWVRKTIQFYAQNFCLTGPMVTNLIWKPAMLKILCEPKTIIYLPL